MKEIISSILEAESEAESKVGAANETAKSINAESILKAQNVKDKAVSDLKSERIAALKKAEEEAEAEYAEILKKGEAYAKEVRASAAGRIDAAAEKTVKRVLG